MSLLYRLVSRKNPLQPAATPKWYAESVLRGVVTVEELLDAACEGNTLDRDEMRMGLNRAFAKAADYLEMGFGVHFGDLGHVDLSIRSKGTENPEDASAHLITDIVPHFAFGKKLRERIRQAKVEREATK